MIESHEGRNQVVCDSCPRSYPNTYAAEDFAVMISDAKTAGWLIRKAPPARDEGDTAELFAAPPKLAKSPGARPQPYTHTCPDCAAQDHTEGRML